MQHGPIVQISRSWNVFSFTSRTVVTSPSARPRPTARSMMPSASLQERSSYRALADRQHSCIQSMANRLNKAIIIGYRVLLGHAHLLDAMLGRKCSVAGWLRGSGIGTCRGAVFSIDSSETTCPVTLQIALSSSVTSANMTSRPDLRCNLSCHFKTARSSFSDAVQPSQRRRHDGDADLSHCVMASYDKTAVTAGYLCKAGDDHQQKGGVVCRRLARLATLHVSLAWHRG